MVDWSDLIRDQRWQLLRASVVVEGRSITLYEEVHGQKKLGNAQVHRRFLPRLRAMLPPECLVIVMTDTGFHATWFKRVKCQDWQFVGRIGGRNRVQLGAEGPWIPARDLYHQASLQARDWGQGSDVRSDPVAVRVVRGKRPK